VGWLRQHSVLVTICSLLLLSSALLLENSRGRRRVDPLGVVFLELVAPVASLSEGATARLAEAWKSYVDLVGIREEREWLRTRVRELERDLDRQRRTRDENHRLKAVLALRDEFGGMPVAARITGIGASQLFQTATINRGTSQGVAEGMAVLARPGVVGRIVAASPNAARVLLIEDPTSGVDAVVQRSRARGIVEGGGGGLLHLKFVRRDEELRLGDEIVTSGLDGIFPRGIPLGHIAAVQAGESGLFQTAELAPVVDFSKLEEVLVLELAEREMPPAAGERD
jgi:rod shape-determining protein MreC